MSNPSSHSSLSAKSFCPIYAEEKDASISQKGLRVKAPLLIRTGDEDIDLLRLENRIAVGIILPDFFGYHDSDSVTDIEGYSRRLGGDLRDESRRLGRLEAVDPRVLRGAPDVQITAPRCVETSAGSGPEAISTTRNIWSASAI
jgi:hypothetical protein